MSIKIDLTVEQIFNQLKNLDNIEITRDVEYLLNKNGYIINGKINNKQYQVNEYDGAFD